MVNILSVYSTKTWTDVVNILPGYGPTAGAAISEHMDVYR